MTSPADPSGASADALSAILANPGGTLVGLDFDGTLAPIVDDPEQAFVDPDAVAALGRLGRLVGAVVVITGRPVRTAVRLGRFTEIAGLESMVVMGQYGVERWDAATNAYQVPPEPPAIVAVAEELPSILASLGLSEAPVEHKGRALGIHTRTLDEPADAFERLTGPLSELADRHGLKIEPGKNVWEIRAPGIDKGAALRAIMAETGARTVIFAGDDLGDLPAFETVRELCAEGIPGLLVCSASHEEDALTAISDVIVDGPPGVATWLTQLVEAIESRSSTD
jgi:trehalose 6-phosphate phosphatase